MKAFVKLPNGKRFMTGRIEKRDSKYFSMFYAQEREITQDSAEKAVAKGVKLVDVPTLDK